MTEHSPPAPTHATSVRQRILHGLGANAFGQLVTVIVQLAGVPILLHAWGVQLYGEWLILFAIPAYLSMTDLGFTQSAANDMTARVARGDRAGALAVFQSLGVLVYAVAMLGLFLTAAVLPWLPLADWLNFQAMDARTAQWVLWLLAAQVLVTLPDGVTHAGFRAGGEYALHVGLHSIVRLLQFAGVWIAALAGGGPLAAAGVFMGVRVLATAAFALLVVRRHRWLRYGRAAASATELRRLLRPALANMAIPLAQALNIQGMVVAVGAVLGPLAVVVFSTLRTLTRLAMQMVMIVANATEPELATAHGAGNRQLLSDLFVHALRGGLWLALLAAAGLALFGGHVLELWTHGRVAMDGALFGWLLASAVASVLWLGGLTVLKAANRHLRAAAVYVFASAAAVGLAATLLEYTDDLAYAGMALLVMDVAMTGYALAAATNLLGIHPVMTLAQAANPLPFLYILRSKAFEH
jgi:O-antigen/teichoic acid export membrane protein